MPIGQGILVSAGMPMNLPRLKHIDPWAALMDIPSFQTVRSMILYIYSRVPICAC